MKMSAQNRIEEEPILEEQHASIQEDASIESPPTKQQKSVSETEKM